MSSDTSRAETEAGRIEVPRSKAVWGRVFNWLAIAVLALDTAWALWPWTIHARERAPGQTFQLMFNGAAAAVIAAAVLLWIARTLLGEWRRPELTITAVLGVVIVGQNLFIVLMF